MKKLFALIVLICFTTGALACTSVIITGKATKDGRPLMWKNTDGGSYYSSQRFTYQDAGKYAWVGLALDDKPQQAWFGANEKGFCIMNTSSHNLLDEELNKKKQNGYIMKVALEECETLQDFVNMLDTIQIPAFYITGSHYGVIDAKGGAAYIETRFDGQKVDYWVFDVNDPKVAPDGYLVYSNWSVMGATDQGGGYIRKVSAEQIIAKGRANKEYTPRWIFDKCSRSYYNSLIDMDLREMVDNGQKIGWFPDSDFIPRNTTLVASVIQGVKKGENPLLTTLWTVPGCPSTGVAIPAWVAGGKEGLNILVRGNDNNHNDLDIKNNNSIMGDWSLKLKTQVFSLVRGNGQKYFNFEKLYNVDGTGYIQQLSPVEQEVYDMTMEQLASWRKKGAIDKQELADLNAKIFTRINSTPLFKDIPYTYKYGKIGK